MYKTKLQETCVVKSWTFPKYSAVKDGPDHNPRFTASVFVNGVSFDSPTSCKSVKEAHNKAAEAALMHFISSSSTRLPNPSPGYVISKDGSKMAETSKSTTPAEVREVPKEKPELKKKPEENESNASAFVSSCNLRNTKSAANPHEREIEAAKLDMNLLSLKESAQDFGPKLAPGRPSKPKKLGQIITSKVDGSPTTKGKEKLMSKESNAPAETSVDSKKHKDPEVSSFLLCNRIRVYSYVPDISNLPKGVTVLQICDGKWVAMQLEFPNEKSN